MTVDVISISKNPATVASQGLNVEQRKAAGSSWGLWYNGRLPYGDLPAEESGEAATVSGRA